MRIMSVFAVLMLLALTACTPTPIVNTESFVVKAGYSQTWSLQLAAGDTVEGTFNIVGGSGDDVNFRILDPVGTMIANMGRVSRGSRFSFVAREAGWHVWEFDNGFSIFLTRG